MDKQYTITKDKFYSKDHEWIDFQGAVAYVGVCYFKLTGFKQIEEISFKEPSGHKEKGAVIALVKYNDYQVEVNMPVDGKVLRVNQNLVSGNPNILLNCAESSAWIALIVPTSPHERKDLLQDKAFHMHAKK